MTVQRGHFGPHQYYIGTSLSLRTGRFDLFCSSRWIAPPATTPVTDPDKHKAKVDEDGLQNLW